jgi:hypothetical protein
MAQWIEFHDSYLQRATVGTDGAELLLEAYVHQWERHEGCRVGTGWYRPVRLAIGAPAAGCEVHEELEIYRDRFTVGTKEVNDLIPLPFSDGGLVTLWLQGCDGREAEFSGRGVSIEAIGEARFVENLPDDMRPSEAG